MGRISDDLANAVLAAVFGGAALTLATHHAIALSTTEPADDGTGVTEPVGNAYARAVVANDGTTWDTPALRSTANTIPIVFPKATGDWGDLGWFVVYDNGTGAFLGWGRLASTTTIGDGITASFDVGALVITAPGT